MATRQIRLLPAHKKSFKITLFLDASEYTALMRSSAAAGLEAGKISMHKFFKKITGIENARAEAKEHQREIAARLRHWSGGKSTPAGERQIAQKRVKRNSPRKLAA